MQRKITRFARGVKWDFFGASGLVFSVLARAACSCASAANAKYPNPEQVIFNKVRRDSIDQLLVVGEKSRLNIPFRAG